MWGEHLIIGLYVFFLFFVFRSDNYQMEGGVGRSGLFRSIKSRICSSLDCCFFPILSVLLFPPSLLGNLSIKSELLFLKIKAIIKLLYYRFALLHCPLHAVPNHSLALTLLLSLSLSLSLTLWLSLPFTWLIFCLKNFYQFFFSLQLPHAIVHYSISINSAL